MEPWQIILTVIGGSGLATAIVQGTLLARIRRSIEHEYSVKETHLKAELDGKLEGLKAGYQKALDENQIRFSRFDADQAGLAKRSSASSIGRS